jgi:uncharacterized protein (TIGR02452 family)
MNRNIRAQIANETVEIAERGWYVTPSGKRIDISSAMQRCLDGTTTWTPPSLEATLSTLPPAEAEFRTSYDVRNETTLSAARRLVAEFGEERTLCLNFASAKNPGGGFLGGSQAQEESLARSSGLYRSLLSQPRYYEANRACGTSLYTDHMILSPAAPVFRDDAGNLLESPYCVGILTAPAVNAGAVQANEPHRAVEIRDVMARRIGRLLALAAAQRYEHLILGAWGCGVFRNDPMEISDLFAAALHDDSRFRGRFKTVVFAVLDGTEQGSIIAPFQSRFAVAETAGEHP